MFTWVQKLRRARGERSTPRPTCRPCLEGLEDRLLLTAGFIQTNLVSNTSGTAANTDTNLVDPRGLASSNTGAFLIADSGGAITSYLADGSRSPLGSPVVTIPPPTGSSTSTPTAIVYNNSASNFMISAGGTSVPAEFLFATADGSIYGWTPGFNNNQPIQVLAGGSASAGADFTGLTLGTLAGSSGSSTTTTNNNSNPPAGTYLYAVDFHTGTIDVYNSSFTKVNLPGAFTDSSLPAGYAPLGIQSINGQLYVTYAYQDSTATNPVTGTGQGFVDVFDTSGNFVRRLNAPSGTLDAPWAVTIAPASFGAYGGDILVGNYGTGQIDAFDPTTGNFLGTLTNAAGQTLTIPGLASLAFGNGGSAGSPSTLYFTAGVAGQPKGLFGSLTASTDQPLTGQPASPQIIPGTAFTGTVATFTDADTTGTPTSYTATIDWGDGTPATTGVITAGTTPGSFLVSGTHTYAKVGSFNIKVVVTDTDTSKDTGGSMAIISAPVDVGNANDLYINQLYEDLLGRPAEAYGLGYWSVILAATNSRTAVVDGIETSAEYAKDVIENDYQTLLGRAADAVGLAYWDNVMLTTSNSAMVEIGIMGSPEYFDRMGATTTGLLNGIFQQILNRPPTQAEDQQWLPLLGTGATGSNVAMGLMTSSEGAQDEVQALSQRFLHQGADSTTLTTYATQLQSGASVESIITALTTSDQYYNNATQSLTAQPLTANNTSNTSTS